MDLDLGKGLRQSLRLGVKLKRLVVVPIGRPESSELPWSRFREGKSD